MALLREAGSGVRELLRRGLQGIASFSVFHPKSVLLVVAAVTALAAWQASTLRISTDVETLLPRNVESARRIKTLLKSFGGSEPVVVAISGKGSDDLEERIDLALAIRERLSGHPDLHTVTGLFGEDPWALLEGPQADALLLYLTPEEIDAVAGRLTPEAIERRVAENREALRSPLGALTARLYAEDPLGFASLALKQIGALKGGLRITSREGILVTEDDAYALILLRPKVNTNDIETARHVLGAVEEGARAALEESELAGTVGIGPPPEGAPPGQIHVGLAGAPATLVGFRSSLAGDLRLVSLTSYFAQLALFALAFRRVGGLLIAGTSLLVGAIWALGFAAIAIGQINIFTVGSIGILCGLTVDFTVHLYNRYLEEVHAGKDMARAFSISHGETGIGILASVGVMVWAFFAAGLSEFRGLRDLGLICGAGLALSLAASLFMVPALTALWVRLYPRPDRPRGLAGFGLEPVLTGVVRRPWLTIAAGLAVTLGLL
ncbi:MAG: MMPL family transporter [Acidobacteria bacterium]|nr:MMPL family transporter [Acidobacteriota bacterium]